MGGRGAHPLNRFNLPLVDKTGRETPSPQSSPVKGEEGEGPTLRQARSFPLWTGWGWESPSTQSSPVKGEEGEGPTLRQAQSSSSGGRGGAHPARSAPLDSGFRRNDGCAKVSLRGNDGYTRVESGPSWCLSLRSRCLLRRRGRSGSPRSGPLSRRCRRPAPWPRTSRCGRGCSRPSCT